MDNRRRDAEYGHILSPVGHDVDGDGLLDSLLFFREFSPEIVYHFRLVLVVASELNQGI